MVIEVPNACSASAQPSPVDRGRARACSAEISSLTGGVRTTGGTHLDLRLRRVHANEPGANRVKGEKDAVGVIRYSVGSLVARLPSLPCCGWIYSSPADHRGYRFGRPTHQRSPRGLRVIRTRMLNHQFLSSY